MSSPKLHANMEPRTVAKYSLERLLGLLGLLDAHPPGDAENALFGAFAPTSSRRTLRSHPRRPLPTNPMPWGGRSRCWSPPTTSESSCSALGPERAVTRVRGGETGLAEREVPRGTCCRAYVAPKLRMRPRLEVDVHEMVRHAVLLRRDRLLDDEADLGVHHVAAQSRAGYWFWRP